MTKLLLLSIAACIFTFCTDKVSEPLSLSEQHADRQMLPDMPFADSSLLSQYSADAEIVPFNISWYITWAELKNAKFFNNKEWVSAKLHRYPIVVYGFDDRPMWYDFILIDKNGKAVGTITSYARKKSAAQIRRASVDIFDYKVAGKNLRADRFLNRHTDDLGVVLDNGAIASKSGGSSLSMPANMTDEEMLAWMRDVFLPAAIVEPAAVDSAYMRMEREYLAEKEQSEYFWENAPALFSMNFEMDDIDTVYNQGIILPIDPPFNPGGGLGGYGSVSIMTVQSTADGRYKWLKQYQDVFTHYPYNTIGWCGPWVASYILAANGIKRDPTDGAHFTQGLMTAPMLNFALLNNSENVIYMDLGGICISDAFWQIRLSRMSATRLFWCNGQLHWTSIYGTTRERGFLGIDFYYYFMEADNGAYVGTENRGSRNPEDGANYSKATWEQSFFAIKDKTTRG